MIRRAPASSSAANARAGRPRAPGRAPPRSPARPPRAARRSGSRDPGRSPGSGARARDPPRRGSARGSPRPPGSSGTGRGAPAGPRRGAAAGRSADPGAVARPPALAHRASGSDGRASRSRPARSPAANRRAPAAPIIAPLSVHRPGRGMTIGIPRAAASAGDRVPQRRVGGHAPAHHDPPGTDLLGRPDRLRRQHVHDRVLEAPGQLGHDRVRQRAALALVGRQARRRRAPAR